MAGEIIQIETDIKIVLPQIGRKMRQILSDKANEIDAIIKKAIDEFDFEEVLTEHIKDKITEGIEEAFSDINLKQSMEDKIWVEINKRLGEQEQTQ